VPVSPDCGICPLQSVCMAFEMNIVTLLPVKSPKKKSTNRYFNYLYIKFQGNTYLQKRVANDVWQNLFEFPLIETDHLLTTNELTNNEFFRSMMVDIDEVDIHKITNPMKHILSHRVIFAQLISITISNQNESINQFIRVPLKEIDRFAVSRLMELFFENGII